MSDKITDIEDFIRDTTINNYMNKSGNTLHDVARYIYTAHVKPMEDALADATEREKMLVDALEASADFIGYESCVSSKYWAKYRAALARVKGE